MSSDWQCANRHVSPNPQAPVFTKSVHMCARLPRTFVSFWRLRAGGSAAADIAGSSSTFGGSMAMRGAAAEGPPAWLASWAPFSAERRGGHAGGRAVPIQRGRRRYTYSDCYASRDLGPRSPKIGQNMSSFFAPRVLRNGWTFGPRVCASLSECFSTGGPRGSGCVAGPFLQR